MARSKDEKSVHLSATTPSMSTIAPNREGNQLQDAVIAIATALGNEVAAMVIRRKHRMLYVLDEFTHECLAIRVARKLKAIDVTDTLSDLFILRGVPSSHPVRQRTGVRRQGRAGMDRGCRCQDRLHRARQPLGERLHTSHQHQRCSCLHSPVAGCATLTGSAATLTQPPTLN
jgi:hypothetical protein